MLQEAELSGELIQRTTSGGSSESMYYIGLDVHKKTISYCVKDPVGDCEINYVRCCRNPRCEHTSQQDENNECFLSHRKNVRRNCEWLDAAVSGAIGVAPER